MSSLQELVNQVHTEMSARLGEGKVADYIPKLAGVDPQKFGIAVSTVDGEMVTAGDAAEDFSIQSVSKLFTLTLALGMLGDRLWERVDREPSGNAFNSIVQLEREEGKPRNPFVNAGAIAVTDVILGGHQPKEAIGEILRFVQFLAEDDRIAIDPVVAKSEMETGHRNFALAHFMRAHGIIDNDPALVLGVYFHQCAIAMSCEQLARGYVSGRAGPDSLIRDAGHIRIAGTSDQLVDDDVWPLRWCGRLCVSRGFAGQEWRGRRHTGDCAR